MTFGHEKISLFGTTADVIDSAYLYMAYCIFFNDEV
jgi:hypothetical protein